MAARSTLYIFESAKMEGLRGFAADRAGERLPEKFGPWTSIGVVRSDQSPPHHLKREAIEAGIEKFGFQLWRKTKPI